MRHLSYCVTTDRIGGAVWSGSPPAAAAAAAAAPDVVPVRCDVVAAAADDTVPVHYAEIAGADEVPAHYAAAAAACSRVHTTVVARGKTIEYTAQISWGGQTGIWIFLS